MSYQIIATELPKASLAFTNIETRYEWERVFKDEDGWFNPEIEWIAPFNRNDLGWEMNVTIRNKGTVNVKAIGVDVYLDDEKLNIGLSLNRAIAKKFSLYTL